MKIPNLQKLILGIILAVTILGWAIYTYLVPDEPKLSLAGKTTNVEDASFPFEDSVIGAGLNIDESEDIKVEEARIIEPGNLSIEKRAE